MNLYTATHLARVENYIDEDGVVSLEEWNDSQLVLADKQRAVVAWLKNGLASIDMLDNAIKELTARKKAMQTRHDNMKDYLLVNMQANGITEINAENFTFSAKIKKNPPKLVITDAGKIPSNMYIYPDAPAPYVDNFTVKEALKAGQIIDGAYLSQDERVEIK